MTKIAGFSVLVVVLFLQVWVVHGYLPVRRRISTSVIHSTLKSKCVKQGTRLYGATSDCSVHLDERDSSSLLTQNLNGRKILSVLKEKRNFLIPVLATALLTVLPRLSAFASTSGVGSTLQKHDHWIKSISLISSQSKPNGLVVSSSSNGIVGLWQKLVGSVHGGKLDSLILLFSTSIIIPFFKFLKVSPIVGFLLAGCLMGPSGFNIVHDVHLVDMLGEIGIVFFLFEMGLELSLDRLKEMRKDVFGLGTSQFLVTAAVITWLAKQFGSLSMAGAIAVGGSLALSSSAFVLQLLKDKGAMNTQHGKSSFGILLLQDLAVVPLLVVVELLGGGGGGMGRALGIAGMKALFAIGFLGMIGKYVLNPLYSVVAKSHSSEAFLSLIMTTVFSMSFFTQGIGLSDTLGAFVAGILLSETKFRHQIESDVSVFRGFLLGLFFMTVGFKLDVKLLLKEWRVIGILLSSLLAVKAVIVTLLGMGFGVPLASAQFSGLLTAQAGEFAFVSLGIAQRLQLLTPQVTQLLLSTVALSMAITPVLAEAGAAVSTMLNKDAPDGIAATTVKTLEDDKPEVQHHQTAVILCGFGRVGQFLATLLDRKNIAYIAIDNDPQRVEEARSRGLPVYFGTGFRLFCYYIDDLLIVFEIFLV